MEQCEVSVHHTAQKHKAVSFPHLYAFLVNPASGNVLPLLLARVILHSHSLPAYGVPNDYLFPWILN